MISVVLPIYNEVENLNPVLDELERAFEGLDYEILAVDDGSDDGSSEVLDSLGQRHPSLRTLRLDRNRGQSAALAAGFEEARGELIMTMDADGQNDPRDGRRLLEVLLDRKVSAVVGYRASREDPRWTLFQSRIANRFRDWMTGDRVRDTGCSLKLMRCDVLSRVPRFDGMHRFLPTLLRVAGGTVVEIPVTHRPRLAGRSKYGMWRRLWRGVRDTLGVRWLMRRAIIYTIVKRTGSDEAA
jgi:dolichol-phosphate mannosyltransferase